MQHLNIDLRKTAHYFPSFWDKLPAKNLFLIDRFWSTFETLAEIGRERKREREREGERERERMRAIIYLYLYNV